MKYLITGLVLSLGLASSNHANAQLAVTAQHDHQQLLRSNDPHLQANKKLVYDFWREVFEAGHMELAEKYLTEDYQQHNPNVGTGRAAFVDLLSRIRKPSEIAPRIKMPLVSIIAERDLVTLVFVAQHRDPKDQSKTYTSTWFDMFRIENGKIAEHWDPDTKQ